MLTLKSYIQTHGIKHAVEFFNRDRIWLYKMARSESTLVIDGIIYVPAQRRQK